MHLALGECRLLSLLSWFAVYFQATVVVIGGTVTASRAAIGFGAVSVVATLASLALVLDGWLLSTSAPSG